MHIFEVVTTNIYYFLNQEIKCIQVTFSLDLSIILQSSIRRLPCSLTNVCISFVRDNLKALDQYSHTVGFIVYHLKLQSHAVIVIVMSLLCCAIKSLIYFQSSHHECVSLCWFVFVIGVLHLYNYKIKL